MEFVDALVTQVAKKRKLDPTVKGLDSLISALRGWQREAEAGSSGTDALSAQVSAQGLQELVHGHHKAVNAAVSKLGKGIDKSMASHVDLPLERMPHHLVAEAVHRHLLVEGSFEAASLMGIDSGSKRGGDMEAALREMHAVLVALHARQLEPAFRWLETHREGLEARGSTLEFRLRQLEFTLLLQRGARRRRRRRHAATPPRRRCRATRPRHRI